MIRKQSTTFLFESKFCNFLVSSLKNMSYFFSKEQLKTLFPCKKTVSPFVKSSEENQFIRFVMFGLKYI